MRRLFLGTVVLTASVAWPQDPFVAAAQHYHKEFENDSVLIARVSYGAHEKSPEHQHPARPTVYVYTTDGGPLLFNHDGSDPVQRPPVRAGQVRFARPVLETHEVEYKGDQPATYVRVELKTQPVDLPEKDVRLGPDMPAVGEQVVGFENGQIRIVKETCAANKVCPESAHPGDPAVLVMLKTSKAHWVPANGTSVLNANNEPIGVVRIELKTPPLPKP